MENWLETEISRNLNEVEEILARANCGEGIKNSVEVRICRIRKAISPLVRRGASNANLSMRFWERRFREETISG